MYSTLNKFRFLSLIAVISSLAGSFLMFIVGAIKTYHAFVAVFFGGAPNDNLAHLKSADIATVYLIQSLDVFLIALVLFIFSHGVYTLFIAKAKEEKRQGVLGWIDMPSISHLKNVLAEVIVLILFVKFLEVALINMDNLSWELAVLPVSIVLLAVSIKFLALKSDGLKT